MALKNQKSRKARLATGGGNATAGGVRFQALVGAIFAAQLLAEQGMDHRLRLGGARVLSIRFETESPVDDIVVETDRLGWIFIQAKSTLTLSAKENGALAKTAEQIVRQYQYCAAGTGKRGWDRPILFAHDRIVIAVGELTSKSIVVDLASGLEALQAASAAPLNVAQQKAIDTFSLAINNAWKKIIGTKLRPSDIRAMLSVVTVLKFDVEGPDRSQAISLLGSALEDPSRASGAFSVLTAECERLMSARRGTNASDLRIALSQGGFDLKAAPSYRADVASLRVYSERIEEYLQAYEKTTVDKLDIRIDRECTAAVVAAAKNQSLVLVGEPGAGKSAVISAAADRLRKEGRDVVELAVDRLPVESLEGLTSALGLSKSLIDVLRNWPGVEPAFLFIDALDASRGGRSESVFRALISELLQSAGSRWKVVASIRTFDLRLGEQFRDLFKGRPPAIAYADKNFGDVCHVHVPGWTETELTELLQKAPSIALAVASGGQKLRDLSLVPFNTRLLADLLSSGVSGEAFGDVGSQVELLALYWRHRVTQIGVGAEVCLKDAVTQMVAARSLTAPKSEAARADPSALTGLLANNVLVSVAGDRYVAFRHHILFDYAVSRLFIDLSDKNAMEELVSREYGIGLMLAPALTFALQELWVRDGAGRAGFWAATVNISGNRTADPIFRSVAARTACELPSTADDVNELALLMSAKDGSAEIAFQAFTHVVGALTVRSEDGLSVALGAWCHIAENVSALLPRGAWPLRTLLHLLIPRIADEILRRPLGTASRNLLAYSLREENPSPQLTSLAIGFVCDTYATDIGQSRQLIEKLLEPGRLAEHAHEDMGWLARKTAEIARSDPRFAAEIYGAIFGHEVRDTTATAMGVSQILPMSSNRRQDYDMAKWALKEAFPAFLRTHPTEAVDALVSAVAGNIAIEHPIDEYANKQAMTVNGHPVSLREDRSHAWAWDVSGRHGDNVTGLIAAFISYLATATEQETLSAVMRLVRTNQMAILWARIFMAGAKRPEPLGRFLWPYASQIGFVTSLDTRKDAIDLLSTNYGLKPIAVREAFERSVLQVTFPESLNPEATKLRLISQVFGAIDPADLVTPEARASREAVEHGSVKAAPRRPFTITTSVGAPERFWWIAEKGIDLGASENAPLLTCIELVTERLKLNGGAESPDLVGGVALLQGLANVIAENKLAAPLILDHSAEVLARGCARLAGQTAELRSHHSVASNLANLVEPLLQHPSPQISDDDERKYESDLASAGGVRTYAAEAAIELCRVGNDAAKRLVGAVKNLVRDKHPSVRLTIAQELGSLWEVARDDMWECAWAFARSEKNRGVLRFFSDFLQRAVHAAPDQVEQLTLEIIARESIRSDGPALRLKEATGTLVTLLWVSHGKQSCFELLQQWLKAVAGHEEELSHGISSIRDGLVLGYGAANPKDDLIRSRCQRLAADVVDVTVGGVEQYFALPAEQKSEVEQQRAKSNAQLLDHTVNQFFFASGAFKRQSSEEAKSPLTTVVLKRAFLDDNRVVLRRVGDAGTPGTIYHLIELLEFIVEADPAGVFDLVAHSLLKAGKAQGFQFESLGADRFVQIVGLFLADHREIFVDDGRREALVLCLDVFVEAGWPSARRLLYRLPELLQ